MFSPSHLQSSRDALKRFILDFSTHGIGKPRLPDAATVSNS